MTAAFFFSAVGLVVYRGIRGSRQGKICDPALARKKPTPNSPIKLMPPSAANHVTVLTNVFTADGRLLDVGYRRTGIQRVAPP